MGVRLETIMDLLEHQEWSACIGLVERAFAEGENTTAQKAALNFAACKCYSNLERYTAALEPGQVGAFLAEEIRDYDLLGKALLELAWVQHKIPGMERRAPETQRRFLQFFPKYKELKDRYLSAQFNLGVYLRGAGLLGEALNQFKSTYQEARKRGEHPLAHLSRSSAVWEALRLERILEAEDLIKQGESYQSADPRLRASHLLDKAQVAILKGNTHSACDLAVQAAVQCRRIPDLLAQALEIIQKVADREGDGELAIAAGLIAKLKAESDDRNDIADQVSGAVRSLALRYPEAVERLMSTIDEAK